MEHITRHAGTKNKLGAKHQAPKAPGPRREGVEAEAPKAPRSRRRRRRGGEVWGGRFPLPIRQGGLGERRKLPQRGPGRSPGAKRIWCIL